MEKPKEILAIIPARAGSKRLPKKNTRLLNGIPLINYSLDAASKSKYITKIVVLTDDQEVAKRAIDHNSEIEIIEEPEELTKDHVPAIKFIKYTIDYLKKEKNYNPDIIIVLQATTPLRKGEHIDEGIKLLISTKADSVVGVREVSEPPEWMYSIKDQNKLKKITKEIAQNFQQSKKLYILNGAFYGFTPTSFKKFDTYLFGGDIRGYIMDLESSIDIDKRLDFQIAETVIKDRSKNR